MAFVFLHLALFGLWIAANLGWLPGVPRFARSFVILAMFASVEAIFLSTLVLISQNRMTAAFDKQAELDLQVSLLAEHEVTQILTLVDARARQMGVVRGAPDPAVEESKHDVDPAAVLEEIETRERERAN